MNKLPVQPLLGGGVQDDPGQEYLDGQHDRVFHRTGYPSLTTVRQDAALRAGIAVASIEAMGRGQSCAEKIVLPVTLLPRESTGGVSCQNL